VHHLLILHLSRRCAPETLHSVWTAARARTAFQKWASYSALDARSAERTTKPDPDGRLVRRLQTRRRLRMCRLQYTEYSTPSCARLPVAVRQIHRRPRTPKKSAAETWAFELRRARVPYTPRTKHKPNRPTLSTILQSYPLSLQMHTMLNTTAVRVTFGSRMGGTQWRNHPTGAKSMSPCRTDAKPAWCGPPHSMSRVRLGAYFRHRSFAAVLRASSKQKVVCTVAPREHRQRQRYITISVSLAPTVSTQLAIRRCAVPHEAMTAAEGASSAEMDGARGAST
jgi:hypothetical protein